MRADRRGVRGHVKLVQVDCDELERKLGQTAWVMWQLLCDLRAVSPDGVVFASLTYLGAPRSEMYPKLGADKVKRALERLRKAGLVRDLGNAVRQSGAKVFERVILGERIRQASSTPSGLLPVGPAPGMWAPEQTARWLVAANGWGGHRHGNPATPSGRKPGRPKGSRDRVPRKRRGSGGDGPQEPRDTGSNKPVSRCPPREFSEPIIAGSRCPPDLAKPDRISGAREASGSLLPPAEDPRPPRCRAGVVSESSERMPDALGAALGEPVPTAPLDSDRMRLLTQPELAGLPAYPGISVISPPRVPRPPLLDPAASEQQHVEALVTSYRNAFASEFGSRPPVGKNVGADGGKLRGRIARSARAMLDARIAPAWWCVWSFRVWRQYAGADGKLPSIAWIFSPGRIVEHTGRFHEETGTWLGARRVDGPIYRQLIQSYQAMRNEVLRERAVTTEHRAAIAARYFPGDAYERLLESARDESKQIEDSLSAQCANGRFLWA